MKFYFNRLSDGYAPVVSAGFDLFRAERPITSSTRVCIKPNLTFPVFQPGVMTNPEAIEAVVAYLKNFTDHITICESDSGGYNRFSMDEVFTRTGIRELQQRYGIKVVNLSFQDSREISFRYRWHKLKVPMPILLLDETDLFITMPVPKVHANTTVSLALKNQWGVIPEPSLRLKLHPYFREVIRQVNKALPPMLVVVDGKYGLTRNGPMRGDVVNLGWFLMCDNPFHADYVMAAMMGFDPVSIPYLRYILSRERVLDECSKAKLPLPPSTEFYLHREWTDYPGLMTFRSSILAYLGYESVLSRPLHWALYCFRNPFY